MSSSAAHQIEMESVKNEDSTASVRVSFAPRTHPTPSTGVANTRTRGSRRQLLVQQARTLKGARFQQSSRKCS